jgi:hypothetical protein
MMLLVSPLHIVNRCGERQDQRTQVLLVCLSSLNLAKLFNLSPSDEYVCIRSVRV